MTSVRRRLASWGLVLCLVQVTALFAAPVGGMLCPAGSRHRRGRLLSGRRARTRPVSAARRDASPRFAPAFNLTNRTNVVTMNGTFGAGASPANPLPNFRQPTAVGDPGFFQVGLRL